MQSTNWEDFDGYQSEQDATDVATNIAKENRLKKYEIIVFQK